MVFGYLTLFLLGGSILNYFLLRAENNKRRSGQRDHLAEGKTKQELERMGDQRYFFLRVYISGVFADFNLFSDRILSTLCRFVHEG